jgi:hypothetical protein
MSCLVQWNGGYQHDNARISQANPMNELIDIQKCLEIAKRFSNRIHADLYEIHFAGGLSFITTLIELFLKVPLCQKVIYIKQHASKYY